MHCGIGFSHPQAERISKYYLHNHVCNFIDAEIKKADFSYLKILFISCKLVLHVTVNLVIINEGEICLHRLIVLIRYRWLLYSV